MLISTQAYMKVNVIIVIMNILVVIINISFI